MLSFLLAVPEVCPLRGHHSNEWLGVTGWGAHEGGSCLLTTEHIKSTGNSARPSSTSLTVRRSG